MLIVQEHNWRWGPIKDYRRIKANRDLEIFSETIKRKFNQELQVKSGDTGEVFDSYNLSEQYRLDGCVYLECIPADRGSSDATHIQVVVLSLEKQSIAFRLKNTINCMVAAKIVSKTVRSDR